MASSTKGRIELELRAVSQLFNSMDPSPLRDKDLRQDVEEFIVSWAWEFPVRTPLSLTIHLVEMPPSDPAPMLQEAVQNYFSYRAGLTGLGGDVAAGPDLSPRLVAAVAPGEDFREAEPDAGNGRAQARASG